MFSKDSERTTQPDVVEEVTERKERINNIIRCINAQLEDSKNISKVTFDTQQAEEVYYNIKELYADEKVNESAKRDMLKAIQLFEELNEILHYRDESQYDPDQIDFQQDNEA